MYETALFLCVIDDDAAEVMEDMHFETGEGKNKLDTDR